MSLFYKLPKLDSIICYLMEMCQLYKLNVYYFFLNSGILLR